MLSKQIDVLELYRVHDIHYDQPFLLRLFGLSNILLISSDVSEQVQAIAAVRNGRQLHEKPRNLVEPRRTQRNVWEQAGADAHAVHRARMRSRRPCTSE